MKTTTAMKDTILIDVVDKIFFWFFLKLNKKQKQKE
tara:strand:+ start:1014 stop:1121 length:108 start_codon:yes stop_codon:yes gene_type:complete